MQYLILFGAWIAWGVWAVAIKYSGDLAGLRWTLTLESVFIFITLPLDFYLIKTADWSTRPDIKSIVWVAVLVFSSIAGGALTVKAAPYFNSNVLTIVSASYPAAAMLLFWALGTRPTIQQAIGFAVALIGIIIIALGEK